MGRLDFRSARLRVLIALAFILIGLATLLAGKSKNHSPAPGRDSPATTTTG